MGSKSLQARKITERTIRSTSLSAGEKAFLLKNAAYEGSPLHKRNPGDFGLTPSAAPRPHKTLCDEAKIFKLAEANRLLKIGIEQGLVSEYEEQGFPKNIWIVQGDQVLEAMYGGSRTGRYHGYPIRNTDPLFYELKAELEKRS